MTEPSQLKPDEFRRGGCFPLEYYTGFLNFLTRHSDRVQIITYDDLRWGDDFDYRAGYKAERQRWQEAMASGELDARKTYVLLQHDADSRAERTMRILAEEERRGVPSSLMMFRRRVDRRLLKLERQLEFTDYPISLGELGRLESTAGFIVGYHINAFEQALWNHERAADIFVDDVLRLRERLPIRYCSAHGGVPDTSGRNNRDLTLPAPLEGSIRWVHNGYSPHFDSQYSDGGINNPSRDPAGRDLRDFVRSWKPGSRYRVLTHPQYYNSPVRPSARLEGTAWYDQLIAQSSRDPEADPWHEVELGAW